MDSALETMQVAAVSALTKEQFFTPVPIMHERKQNVRSELAKAVNRLSGIAILILTPGAGNNSPATPGPHMKVTLTAEIAENVLINTASKGSQLPCSLVAEQVAAHLHLVSWMPGKTLVCKDIKIVPNKAYVVYRVTFETNIQIVKL